MKRFISCTLLLALVLGCIMPVGAAEEVQEREVSVTIDYAGAWV